MKKNKKLIAIFTNNDDDIYCFRKELIEEIIENRYDVLISCPYGEKFELMNDIKYEYDDPFIDRRGTNIFNDLKLFFHYFNLLRKYKPSVVLTYTAKPNIYCGIAAHFLKIPVISNVTGFGSVIRENGLVQKLVMCLFKLTFRRSACVMFQNETNKKFAEKNKFIKGDSLLIPGSGVNIDRYPLQRYPDGGNGIYGETVVFNYIGRIMYDKGVNDYIKAAEIIKKDYPNTCFNMLGFIEPTEDYYEDILSDLEKKDVVHYLGSQKDIKPFVALSHATIHPSVYGEGMSNVLLESASSGRPVITTDNPGCYETVKKDITGFIYEGGNIEALCDNIKRFLSLSNTEREDMGKKGREYMISDFSRKIVTTAYLNKINELCSRK